MVQKKNTEYFDFWRILLKKMVVSIVYYIFETSDQPCIRNFCFPSKKAGAISE